MVWHVFEVTLSQQAFILFFAQYANNLATMLKMDTPNFMSHFYQSIIIFSNIYYLTSLFTNLIGEYCIIYIIVLQYYIWVWVIDWKLIITDITSFSVGIWFWLTSENPPQLKLFYKVHFSNQHLKSSHNSSLSRTLSFCVVFQ